MLKLWLYFAELEHGMIGFLLIRQQYFKDPFSHDFPKNRVCCCATELKTYVALFNEVLITMY